MDRLAMSVVLAAFAVVLVMQFIKLHRPFELECSSLDDEGCILHEWLRMKLKAVGESFVEVIERHGCVVILHKRQSCIKDAVGSCLALAAGGKRICCVKAGPLSVLQTCLESCKNGDLCIDALPGNALSFAGKRREVVLFERGTTLEKMLVELDMKSCACV